MKKRKMVCILLAGLIAASMVSGCNKAQDAAQKEGDVTLSWYFPGDPSLKDNGEVYNKASSQIHEKLGVKVNFLPVDSGSYANKMKMIIAGGENYDICWTSNWTNDYVLNVTNGAFIPLDELLQNAAPKLKSSISDNIWAGTKVGGKIYGIPNLQIMARSTGLYVPQQFYEKYSSLLEGAKAYEDLDPYMAAVAKDYPAQAIVTFGWQDLLYAYGIEEILGTKTPGAISLHGNKNDIKVYNQFDTDLYRNLIKLRKSWVEKGYTIKDVLNGSGQKSKYLPQEKPFYISTYKPGGDVDQTKRQGWPVKMIQMSPAYLTTAGILSSLNAISINSKHQEQAIKLLEYVNTNSDIMNLLTYGIENTHYTKIDENIVATTPNAGFSNNSWVFGNVFNSYVIEGMNPNTWAMTKEINDMAIVSKLIGFSANTGPILLEINNCKSVMAEYTSAFEAGIGDMDDLYGKFLAKLQDAGVNKIIEELQRQIDQWVEQQSQ